MSIVIPFTIAGIRLAFQAPEILFGQRAFQRKSYSILGLLVIPFHPLIMKIREEILNQKLQGKNDSNLEAKRINIQVHLRQFKRCELGIETIYQICGQAILALYAVTETKTTEGLVKLFENNPQDKLSSMEEEKIPSVFQSRTFILTYLILSTVWSCFSCISSSIASLSLRREHFPTMSKLMANMFTFCSLLKRVFCIVMYFAVPFGLFNLLRHSQSEQAHWDPIIKNFFLDQNGYIQFGKSPKILWSSINRWNSTLQTPPSYRLYTEFGLKHYFLAFWVVTIIQFIVVFLAKLKISLPFVRMSLTDKIVHIMENINVYQCTED